MSDRPNLSKDDAMYESGLNNSFKSIYRQNEVEMDVIPATSLSSDYQTADAEPCLSQQPEYEVLSSGKAGEYWFSIDIKIFEMDETNECGYYKTERHRPHKDRMLTICGLTIPHAFHLAEELTIWPTMSLQVLKELSIPMICELAIPHEFRLAKELMILPKTSLQMHKELFMAYTALMKISFGLVLKIHALFSILQSLGTVRKVLQNLDWRELSLRI